MKTAVMIMTISALFFGGCSPTRKFSFDIEARRVTILTEPAGAAVTQINPVGQASTSLGQTPIEDRSIMIVSKMTKWKNMPYHETKKMMEQVGNVVVRIEKDGYETYCGTLRTDPKETVVHKIKLQPKDPENK